MKLVQFNQSERILGIEIYSTIIVSTQVQHYTDTISKRIDWDLVDIYADDGISGTTTTKRTEFLRMINECMAGKIDMIITKSISRWDLNPVRLPFHMIIVVVETEEEIS